MVSFKGMSSQTGFHSQKRVYVWVNFVILNFKIVFLNKGLHTFIFLLALGAMYPTLMTCHLYTMVV